MHDSEIWESFDNVDDVIQATGYSWYIDECHVFVCC